MESLGQMPAAMASVLEKSALDLIADRLRQAGLKGRQVEAAEAPAAEGSIEVKVRIAGAVRRDRRTSPEGHPAVLARLADLENLLALGGSPDIAAQISLPPAGTGTGHPAGRRCCGSRGTGDVLLLDERMDDAPVTIAAAGRGCWPHTTKDAG